ncbi:MAG: hypothetical protein Q4E54_03520 [Lachnospiraceae bacterium]|nr:hypothetical protein [Lachnospiraceae bacterium]
MKDTDYEALLKKIKSLEEEISGYPVGSISRKIINGKERYYHQWYELGRTKSRYLKQDEVEEFRKNIEMRKKAEIELKTLKKKVKDNSGEKGIRSFLNKEMKASINFPVEITGFYNGRYIIPYEKIRFSPGQKILLTLCDTPVSISDRDIDKYINHGDSLFPEDAQKYIGELRDEGRI